MFYFVFFGCICFPRYTYSFIVRSASEPACPGIECLNGQEIKISTCRCICNENAGLCFNDTNPPSIWPTGSYALPASMYGCPEDDWEMRYINLTLPISSNDMYWESSGTFYSLRYYGDVFNYSHLKDLHILGPYSKRSFQLNFCVKDSNDSSGLQTAQGNFCLYDIGKGCANGFKEGNMTVRGYHIDIVGFGIHSTDSTTVTFCCKEDSNSTLSEVFPHDFPFVLLKGPSTDSCERISDMFVSEDIMFMLRQGIDWEFHGTIPNVTKIDRHIGIHFCFYQPESYTAFDSGELQNPYPLSDFYSLGRPVYSSPYVKSTDNNPNFVVDEVKLIGTLFSTILTRRPWVQIDLQQFIRITHVITMDLSPLMRPHHHLYGMYVSINQWDFVNRGAMTCFFGVTKTDFLCRRPIIGQYVTLTLELEYITAIQDLADFKVYGFPTGCGRNLGMITGDIKDYQIETSSNYKDIHHSRAMQGTEGWCSSPEDRDRWLMVDFIAPTKVQGVILHGWYQIKRMFIQSFVVEFGLQEDNLIRYGEDNLNLKIFTVDTTQDVHILQKFMFLHVILTRYIKIKVIEPSHEIACFKAEFIGCQVYASRNKWCKDSRKSLLSQPKRNIDIGFASVRHIETLVVCDDNLNMTFKECLQRTIDKGYIGNVYEESKNHCCYYNTSNTNRHYTYLWKRNEFKDVITSERLCLSGFYRPMFHLTEVAKFPPILGYIDEIYSPLFPSNYPKGINQYTAVYSSPGMYLKLTILYASFAETETEATLQQSGHTYMNPSPCKDTLSIDIGEGKWIKINRENQKRYRYASFMATGDNIKIHFTTCFTYLISENVNYQLEIESIDYPGCGVNATQFATCTAKNAYIASYLYPSLYTASDTNIWKIRGRYGQYIELQFIELDVNNMALVDSFVEVFDFEHWIAYPTSLGRFTKTRMPLNRMISSWHMMDVEFRVGNDLTGKGFLGLYTIKDVVIETISNVSDCAAAWANFRTSCYKLFYNNHVNLQKAESACVREGGHLVSVNSEEEMTFVHQLITSEVTRAVKVYIGRATIKGISQPDGYDDEQCVAIILNSIHNKQSWHDVPCAYSKIPYFMCETQLDAYNNLVKDGGKIVLGNTGISNLNQSLFTCGNGEVISQLAVCDTYNDCSDKSDEKHCGTKCSSSQYQCEDGLCIHFTFYCDHIRNCKDGSDEHNCRWRSCEDGEWQCDNKQCIPLAQRCDVTIDCLDGSDENNCETCSFNAYQCFDKSCISQDRVCDTISDCPGRYEEDETMCTGLGRFKQTSCEQWWVIGARLNGQYFVDEGTEGIFGAYCEFHDKGNTLLISTYFSYFYVGINKIDIGNKYSESIFFIFPDDMIKSVMKKDKHQCSQNVRVTCYFHDIQSSDFFETYPGFHCFGGTDWSQVDVNKVFTDNVVISNPDRLPFNGYDVPEISYSDEGFYDVTVGPVVCKSEISKNVSSNQSRCSNGQLYNYTDHCIMHVNERSDINGCRDMTHLQNCGNLTCPGLYRCQQSTTCLLFDEVCDNIRQCPHGDDEVGCDVTCPIGCSCEGFIFICHQKEVEKIFLDLSMEVRKLDLSSSLFPNNSLIVPAYTYLAELKLFNCSIDNIMPYTFGQLMNLLHLDLSNNKLKILNSYTFYGVTKLITLNLKDNLMLGIIKPNAFMSLPNIKDLELSGTRIIKLFNGTFNGLGNLETFNITGNGLTTVEENVFDVLVSLLTIDLTQNDVTKFSLDIFSRLSHLTQMKTDSYIFCCLKPKSVSAENCYPKMDEFSSCSDLMRNDALRICLWIIAINALIGNIGVILYRIIYEKTLLFKANWLFIMNLGVSDMLMGLYLGIIAVADMYYSGNYILHDREWRDSLVCKLAGILAAIS
ncbi:unnamed protein product [Mytilus coruscus]|uniref:G-protein coupled receptor GRL101-like protein n=1 Tax=Mytilus coruscus TaxID=42192 RepID=A0A6J8DQG4_MYTCO|nr:unnamed protein product [Mytilus coruscus]